MTEGPSHPHATWKGRNTTQNSTRPAAHDRLLPHRIAPHTTHRLWYKFTHTMLGRQVGTSLLRLPRVAHLPIRSLPQYELAVRTLAPFAHRSYASITPSRPGRPKKAVGEPSRPVKRAVKRAAKSPKEDAATAKVKARKETAAKKKKATAKPTSKAKAPARPKKKVAKKVVSEEQKSKLAAKLVKRKEEKAVKVRQARITELKKIALDPPAVKNLNTWIVFSSERLTGQNMTGLKQDGINAAFAEQQKRSVEAVQKHHACRKRGK